MPRIIENVREQLLDEAKKQIMEKGYAKTTVRSVASACGLGIGTVYNYFSSKEMLIASVMGEDWQECLAWMDEQTSDRAEDVLRRIYDSFSDFMQRYYALFQDGDASKVYAVTFSDRHKQLRAQIAKRVRTICDHVTVKDKDFFAEWVAESLITWTVAGKSFDEQYEIIKHFIQ